MDELMMDIIKIVNPIGEILDPEKAVKLYEVLDEIEKRFEEFVEKEL